MKKLLALVLALAMVFSFAACGSSKEEAATTETTTAEAEKVVFTMGIDPEYPPFSYLGDDGEYTGFDVEICQAACELLGWEWNVFGVNWDEKLVQMDAMECDCIWAGMTLLDSMKEAGYVLSDPYYDSTQVIMVKAGSDIKTKEDLAGKVVAVQLGTSGEAALYGDLADWSSTFDSIVTCDSFVKCFAELDGEAVDAVFIDYPVAASEAAQNSNFVVLDEQLASEQYGIAFRSGDQEMCDQIEAAVQELVENGTYAEIASKDEYAEIVNNLIFLK